MKKLIKRIIATAACLAVTAAAMFTPVASITANATVANGQGLTLSQGSPVYYSSIGIAGGHYTYRYTVSDGTDSRIVYCVQPAKTGPTGGTYNAGTLSDAFQKNAPLMKKILYYGVGGPGYNQEGSIAKYYSGNSEDQQYALTHIALGYAYGAFTNDFTAALYGSGVTLADFTESNSNQYMAQLVRWMNSPYDVPDTAASVSKSSLVADTEYTDSNGEVWVVTHETVNVSGTVTLPSGFAFIADINNPSSTLWANTTQTFEGKNVYVGKLKSKAVNAATDYVTLSGYGMKVMTIDTGASSQMMAYYVMDSNSASLSITYKTTQTITTLDLMKTGLAPTSISGSVGNYTFNWTNQGVAGAKYGIYAYTAFTDANGKPYAAGEVLATATTGAGGKITIDKIPVSGNEANDQETIYYIKEITAAPGFKLDGNAYGLKWTKSGRWSGTTITSGVCNVSDDRIETPVTFATKVTEADTPLAGATMGIYNNEAITVGGTTIPAGTLIRSAVTGSDGKAAIDTSDLPFGKTWYYTEVTAPLGFKLSDDKQYFATDGTAQTPTDNIVDTSEFGKITIEKTGDDFVGISGTAGNYTFDYLNQPLNDFTFEVWTINELTDAVTGWVFPANTKIAEATTGSSTGWTYDVANPITGQKVQISTSATGKVSITNLIFGEYKIVEVDGKQGFVINGTQNTDPSAAEPAKIVSFNNDRISTTINHSVKVDEAGNPLSGATFGLYNATAITCGGVTLPADTLIRSVTTGADGKINFTFTDLPFGYSFYTKEITQPNGYVINSSKTTINIDGTTQNLPNIVNTEQYGILKISKSGEVLTGVTGTDGNYTFTYGTDALDGFKYNVIANEEISAANGWHFTENQVVAEVVTGNASASNSLVDSGSRQLTFTTDAQGNVVVSGLPLGTYRVEEVSGQAGYVIEGSNVVTVAGDDTGLVSVTSTTSFVNRRQECKVEMTKKDGSTDVVLAGAEFTLYVGNQDITLPDGTVVLEKNKAIETITTDATGKATFTAVLPYGFVYIVRETKAPQGYTLSDYAFNFEFTTTDTANQNINLTTGDATISNEYVVGEIEVRKNDSDLLTNVSRGGATLDGATYQVFADGDIMLPDKSGVAYHDGDLIAELVTGKPDKCVTYVSNNITFTSSEAGQIKVTGIYLGKYLVKEKTASEGYLVDITEYSVNLTYVDDRTPIISESIISKEEISKERFFINKKGTDGSESERIIPVKGAEFKLYVTTGLTKSGEKYTIASDSYAVHKMWKTGFEDDYILVASKAEEDAAALLGFDKSEEYVLTSDDKGYMESGFLPYGYYVLHETKVPAGRSACADIVIDLIEDKPTGYWNDGKQEKDYTVYNNVIIIKKNPIKISKYDVTGTKELPGATLRLTDASGNVIDEWVSTEEAHVVSGLIVGQTYTLTEIIAPKNYKLATSIQFVTIKDPNNTMHVIMRDEFNLKIRTGETGLNMWVYLGIMITIIGICATGVIVIRRKKIDVRKIFTRK